MGQNIIDIFSGDAFSALELTDAINKVPYQYGLLNGLGLFTPRGINTTVAGIEYKDGTLNLIPKTERGTPGAKNKSGKRNMKFFEVPRLSLEDKILPSDIQNVRQFGGSDLQTPETVTLEKLEELGRKHDITHEFLKCGAITGKIMDASGDTILDLYTEFGVTEALMGIDMAAEDSDIRKRLNMIKRHIARNLKGDTMLSVLALCSPGYFDALLENPVLKSAYAHYQEARASALAYGGPTANPLRDDVRDGFNFGGVFFHEYDGRATAIDSDGEVTEKVFVPANEARFIPIGTKDTFREFQAPADWVETVNTVGLQKYAKVVPEAGGRFVEILSESDNLPICTRPEVLVRGTLTENDTNIVT